MRLSNNPPRVTRVAVIYATNSGILRRKIVPQFDDAELDAHPPLTGESLLYLPIDQPYDDHVCRAAVAKVIGQWPRTGRCVVVDDNGIVIDTCMADPELDFHRLGQLVLHETAGVGDMLLP